MSPQEENLILIADEDRQFCSKISDYLTDTGARTAVAHSGNQALEMLEQLKPQVIVIDLRQNLENGISLFDAARKQTPSIPIIVTSEHSDVKASVNALRNGAFDYIIKPCQIEFLSQKINQALKTTHLARENMILSELVSLYDITSKLTSTHDLDRLLDIIFKYAVEVSRAECGSLQLYDKENGELVAVRQKGMEFNPLRSSVKNENEWPILKWVVKKGKPLLLVNGSSIPESGIKIDNSDHQSSITVPLKVSKEIIGAVHLKRVSGEPYSIADLNVIDVLASQAGIAVNNANLYASINQKLNELMLISNYSEKLMGLVDKYDVIRCLFNTIIKNFSLDVVAFLVARKRSYELLYFSKGTIVDGALHEICRSVVKVYNTAASAAIQERRVSIKRLHFQQSSSQEDLKPPFSFEHILPVCWEDLKFGAIYFGALNEIPNAPEKITLLSSLVSQTRIALTNSKLYSDMKENYIRTIKALAIAVDAKDTYTHGHSENVMNIAEEIAREMNIDEKNVGIIRDAGLLHDIGKIGIPGYILNKPGPLTYEEFNGIMKTHSNLGANIVKDVPFLHDLHTLILYHHEHYDGNGYPEGLKAEQIPVGARIIHVADAFEAMTSNRPYRESLGKNEAIRRLIEGSGKQFDPSVINAFLNITKRKGWLTE